MRSLLRTALQYLHGVPDDFYGVDVAEIRQTAQVARSDPSVVDSWLVTLDGEQPLAYDRDYAYAARLD